MHISFAQGIRYELFLEFLNLDSMFLEDFRNRCSIVLRSDWILDGVGDRRVNSCHPDPRRSVHVILTLFEFLSFTSYEVYCVVEQFAQLVEESLHKERPRGSRMVLVGIPRIFIVSLMLLKRC